MDIRYENTTINFATLDLQPDDDVKVQPLIGKDVKLILEYTNQLTLFYTLGIFGMVANSINVIVYKRQGLKDSITVNFFALSISDFLVSFACTGMAVCYTLKHLFPNSPVNFLSILYVCFGWPRRFAYSMTCTITTLLSIERCLCVIFPFHVKQIFNKTRAQLFIAVMLVFHLLVFIPIFATNQLRWQDKTPGENNSLTLGLWFAPQRDVIEKVTNTVSSITIPIVSQVIVTCCALVMAHGLKKSASFKQKASTSSISTKTKVDNSVSESGHSERVPEQNTDGDNNENNDKDQENIKQQSGKKESSNRVSISPRDAKLMRTVVVIAVIFFTCNLPVVIFTFVLMGEPKIGINQAYHNTFSVVYSFIYVLELFNSCVNIFIYYSSSTRYKEIFNDVMLKRK